MNKSGQYAILARFGYAHNTERGMTLVEVLLAMGILAAVAAVFLAAMSTSSKAAIVGQQQVAAESLAKSQMESIKQQNYSVAQLYTKITEPTGYQIQIAVARLDPQGIHTGADEGLQKITITITHGGNTVFILEGYKSNIGQ
jgi:prepilin-type N-terminal cleavage/methylation domain-containing protein